MTVFVRATPGSVRVDLLGAGRDVRKDERLADKMEGRRKGKGARGTTNEI